MPARKPGLWELRMTLEGRSLPPQTMQHCIDAATDKQMNALGNDIGKGACSKQDVANVGGKIVFDSECQMGPVKTKSHGEVTGSFDSAYTVKMTSTHAGAPAPGLPAGGTTSMTIDAKWLGACKADQRPGDMILPGGMKMNVNDMQKMQGMRPGAMPPAR
jgi:hypothetical protein